ncbi:transcriptional regulator PpsR [bacterium]|jgi:PAS domain S-box-containing protein|nr:transcriptional regulator PpsR [bacterium]
MSSSRAANTAPTSDLVSYAPDWAAKLIAASSEVTLVLNAEGVIRSVSFGGGEPITEDTESWAGQAWVDTATIETRGKVEQMMREVRQTGASRRRQINHRSTNGGDVPVAYTAVKLDAEHIIVVGRDLRAISSLQQRLVDTQQAMERDYWRLRHVETRYRLLFQLSTDAIVVVDADTMKIVDASGAAGRLFDIPAEKLLGRAFPFGIAPESVRAMDDLAAAARTTGHASDVKIALSNGRGAANVSASCFRQENMTLLLVRIAPDGSAEASVPTSRGRILDLVEHAPDCFVVTSPSGEIVMANRAFLDLAQLGSEEQCKGRSLSQWVGRPAADIDLFLSVLREHGVVRLASSALRGEHGLFTEIEISAVAERGGESPCYGFIMRDVGRRLAGGPRGARDLTKAVEELTGLVGKVSLPKLVRDTTDMVERHFIDAALELTNDNRTTAAEVLGLSRQTLYVKLRRHGISVSGDAAESTPKAG